MTQCTCPDFSSFGHEPGCPMLAELAAQREESTPETKAFMTLIDDSEIDLGMVEAKLGDMERQRDAARLELEGIQAGAEHLNQTIAEMRGWNRLSELNITNLRSLNTEITEDAEKDAVRAKAALRLMFKLDRERVRFASALQASVEAMKEALDVVDNETDCSITSVENALKQAEATLAGQCHKCGGSWLTPLPKFADACNCEGGGGGGFVDLPPAEEKYNA